MANKYLEKMAGYSANVGAILGAATGAARAGEGHRLSGALKGGIAGAALGHVGGKLGAKTGEKLQQEFSKNKGLKFAKNGGGVEGYIAGGATGVVTGGILGGKLVSKPIEKKASLKTLLEAIEKEASLGGLAAAIPVVWGAHGGYRTAKKNDKAGGVIAGAVGGLPGAAVGGTAGLAVNNAVHTVLKHNHGRAAAVAKGVGALSPFVGLITGADAGGALAGKGYSKIKDIVTGREKKASKLNFNNPATVEQLADYGNYKTEHKPKTVKNAIGYGTLGAIAGGALFGVATRHPMGTAAGAVVGGTWGANYGKVKAEAKNNVEAFSHAGMLKKEASISDLLKALK